MKAKKAVKLVRRLIAGINTEQPNAVELNDLLNFGSRVVRNYRKLSYKKMDRKLEDMLDNLEQVGEDDGIEAVNLAEGPSITSREALEEAELVSSHEEALAKMGAE